MRTKTSKQPRLFAIIDPPYPRQPGMIAQKIDDKTIGVYTCSETYRKYKLIARLDNFLTVLNGPPKFQEYINKHYNLLRPLRPIPENEF
jgi:hypothetical protein